MTKLDAINRMLRLVQAEPLTSLAEEDLTYEQQTAIELFEQINRFVQAQGWWFNTFVVTLTRDANGFIVIPENYLQVDPVDPTIDAVPSNGKLYDRTKKTYVFDRDVEVEAVVLLDFEELPPTAQEYITVKAEGAMLRAIYGATTDNSLVMREQEAYLAMMRQQNNAADYNVHKNPQIMRAMWRW